MITLSNIHEFTDEQVFDEVERLLLLQGAKSVSPASNSRCLYSDGQGNRCAVGLLMDHYDPSFECNTLHCILEKFWPSALPKEPILRILQNIHDNHNPEEWEYVFSSTRASLFNNLSESLNEIIYEYKTIQYT